MIDLYSDEYFMKQALKQAEIAFNKDEIPIGAVIVSNKQIITRTHNQTELLSDFTAHAEMLAFTSASEYLGNKYLDKCTLYVTLEPCMMCAGASFWTRIGKIVYAASDFKRGYTCANHQILHPKTEVVSGLMETEASGLLQEFFREKRGRKF